MERGAMEVISERLSTVEDLYFPRSAFLDEAPIPVSARKSALLDLLSRDAPLFLERYGGELSEEELAKFEVLKQDYEVSWHLNQIRAMRRPTDEELRTRSTAVKNRRRAYLERLVKGGVYFSEEAMREREPYLHHEYIGRFQDLGGRETSRPGKRWSETLMRRSEETIIMAKIRAEQQRLGVARKDWVGNEYQEEEVETEEEEEEEEEEDKEEVCVSTTEMEGESEEARSDVPAVELREQMEQFTQIMQHKFLAGEDGEYLDYSRIDNDERLDDHWLRESNLDAEERYFSQD
ncbi:coiled-coil protein [Wolffia australiana]